VGAKLFPPRFPKTDIVFFAQFIEQSIVKCSVRVRCSFFDCLFITVFALPSLKFLWSFIQNVWRISLSVWALRDLLKLNIWPKLDFDLYMTLWPVDLWPFVWNLLCKLQVTFASFTLVWAFYTESQKKETTYNNFGKCGPIFKNLSPVDSWENTLCAHYKRFPSHLQYVAT